MMNAEMTCALAASNITGSQCLPKGTLTHVSLPCLKAHAEIVDADITTLEPVTKALTTIHTACAAITTEVRRKGLSRVKH
jgi:hypothetical protein